MLQEMKECWYGWNRKKEKSDKMKHMGLYSIFKAIGSRHNVKALFLFSATHSVARFISSIN